MMRALISISVALVFALISATGAEASTQWTRLEGPDRYATSAVVASSIDHEPSHGMPPNSVILATGENFPDALTASSFARRFGTKLFLVRRDSIPKAVAQELAKMDEGGNLYIVGGEAAISGDVMIEAMRLLRDPKVVIAFQGRNRYHTAAGLGNYPGFISDGPPAFSVAIVSGENYPDALAAASRWDLVLLTNPNRIPYDLYAAFDGGGWFDRTVQFTIVGGTSAVSESVENQLRSFFPHGGVNRIAGANRYETAALVSQQGLTRPDRVVLASGENFPDALVAGPLTAPTGEPTQHGSLLLTRATCLPKVTAEEMERLNVPTQIVVGGDDVAAVTPTC